MVNSDLVEKYCRDFPKRYLTVKRYMNLDDKSFHLFNHWNILHHDSNILYHSRMNGGNGAIEQNYSQIDFSEFQKHLFVRYEDSFIIFRMNKNGLVGEYLYTTISWTDSLDKKRLWLHENGIKITKRQGTFDRNMRLSFKTVPVIIH